MIKLLYNLCQGYVNQFSDIFFSFKKKLVIKLMKIVIFKIANIYIFNLNISN